MDSLNDLSNYRTVGLMGRLMKQGKRWETTPEIRNRAISLIADVVEDEGENVANRLKAVDLLLKCEAQNMLDDKVSLELAGGGQEVEQPKVILILPSNGSEQSDTIESQEDGA
jgi:hypothetical protein